MRSNWIQKGYHEMILASCAFYCVEHLCGAAKNEDACNCVPPVFQVVWTDKYASTFSTWFSLGPPARAMAVRRSPFMSLANKQRFNIDHAKKRQKFPNFKDIFYSIHQGMLMIHRALSNSDPSSIVHGSKSFLQNDFETFQCFRAFLLRPSLWVGCLQHPIRDWDWLDQR